MLGLGLPPEPEPESKEDSKMETEENLDTETVTEPEPQAEDDDENEVPTAKEETVENPDEALAPAPAAKLTALFAKLPEMSSKDSIDAAAVEFAFLNSKGARKRLIKVRCGFFRTQTFLTTKKPNEQFLINLPKNRLDLLPYYSRLVATLVKYMPDVGTGLVTLVSLCSLVKL